MDQDADLKRLQAAKQAAIERGEDPESITLDKLQSNASAAPKRQSVFGRMFGSKPKPNETVETANVSTSKNPVDEPLSQNNESASAKVSVSSKRGSLFGSIFGGKKSEVNEPNVQKVNEDVSVERSDMKTNVANWSNISERDLDHQPRFDTSLKALQEQKASSEVLDSLSAHVANGGVEAWESKIAISNESTTEVAESNPPQSAKLEKEVPNQPSSRRPSLSAVVRRPSVGGASRRPSASGSLFRASNTTGATAVNSSVTASQKLTSASADVVVDPDEDFMTRCKNWLAWFREFAPDISSENSLRYVDILWDNTLTTPARLAKRLAKNPDVLQDLTFNEDDAEDIIDALARWSATGAVLSPPPASGEPVSANVNVLDSAVKEKETTDALLVSRTKELQQQLELEAKEQEKVRAEAEAAACVRDEQTKKEAQEQALAIFAKYIPADAKDYVNMISIAVNDKFQWGSEVHGLVLSLQMDGIPLWVNGRVLGASKLNPKCHRLCLSDGAEFELNLAECSALKLELSEATLKHAVHAKSKPEQLPRNMFYPELGSIPVPLGAAGVSVQVLESRLEKLKKWSMLTRRQIEVLDGEIAALIEERERKELAATEAARLAAHNARMEAEARRIEEEEAQKREVERRVSEFKAKREKDLLAEAEAKSLQAAQQAKAEEQRKQRAYEEERARVYGESEQASGNSGAGYARPPSNVNTDVNSGDNWAGMTPSEIMQANRKRLSATSKQIQSQTPIASVQSPAPPDTVTTPFGTRRKSVAVDANAPPPPPPPVESKVELASSTPVARRRSVAADPNAPPPPEPKPEVVSIASPPPPEARMRRKSVAADPSAPPPPESPSPAERAIGLQ